MPTPDQNQKHTPGPWRLDTPRIGVNGENLIAGDYHSIDAGCGYYAHGEQPGFGITGIISMEDARLIAASPDLFAALSELLAQVTGPAAIYGNGCGSDGKKTGLSHQEFNALRDERIAQARLALQKATNS